jgi:hypothetical protein
MYEVHLESCCITHNVGIEDNLVWFPEAKSQTIMLHQLAILLEAFATHFGFGWTIRAGMIIA